MTKARNRRIVLAKRPAGMPTDEHLVMEEVVRPTPGDGQMLLKTLYLSLDPYMRGRMSAARSYAASVELGEPMVGGTVSEVVESNVDGFAPGEIVLSSNGWQEYALSDGTAVRKLDPAVAPVTTALGVLGMPGFTAYVGLLEHGRPKPGDTVAVSAASGAVGQVVGQIAKLKGARAVGIAGSDDKCRYVVDELGFDAAVNYKSDDFTKQLAEACPNGIDVYFENVAGPVLEAVLPLFNDFARMPVCGTIAYYNLTELPAGPDKMPALMRAILTRRLTVRGFIQFDHLDRQADFLHDMSEWIRDGRIKYREDIVQGLENTVTAFQGLLQGRNQGKLIIKVA
ncbi:NADP-dependent oxidoreductase [Alkalilimnicola ehrlichii]|uniref:NADP-dependent oxidoreductase n=2 Tax=Alkalilimnicola ehrlichii TaxID=351052 RepID=UPI000E2EE6FC|nr:NADP-dependent oxidoreductase [Alkalilimnicola ehrlichii]RFA27253.1 NADP-dependent oxidoreductase [Alkalilimnicola ehrlichii]